MSIIINLQKFVLNLLLWEVSIKIWEKEPIEQEKTDNKESIESAGKDFLNKLLEKRRVQAEIDFAKTEDGVLFNASGDKVSALIGRHGETLNAIQELLLNVLKNKGYKEGRVYFDVENYKNRREIALVEMAEKMASKAIKLNKPVRLERMSAYERKIIHTALQNFEGVTTQSEGVEPNRHLVIIPEEK